MPPYLNLPVLSPIFEIKVLNLTLLIFKGKANELNSNCFMFQFDIDIFHIKSKCVKMIFIIIIIIL